ncbi:hairy-related 13 [Chanos chanos]|uniref:Transcription cofactor HES-6 n=1 Tax=Chanos chanos TaxID=29144 RepID=A0A6J2VRS1_CHACN|nr:transcription cofactor HES-6-like [Chanos chanos]
MAPVARPSKNGFGAEEDDYYGIKGDRKTRKPLVEKKRRARINESLQELRALLADTDSKMENAEVLELTVKRVENILRNRSHEADTMNREASERFAAGYIQCMHEVHTFVSTCPGIDATVAAELLNHLLECMPLNEDHLQDVILDLMSDAPTSTGAWPTGEALSPTLGSPGGRSVSSLSSALSPTPSTTSSEDLCSDLEEIEHDPGTGPVERGQNTATITYSKSMWRPW